MGKERIDEVFDPELAVNRAVDYYRAKGYDDEWNEIQQFCNFIFHTFCIGK